jgi:acetylornithine deacetylase
VEPPQTTIHVGTVHGGTAVNIISRECRFDWDIRAIAEDPPAPIVQEFQRHCDERVVPQLRRIAPGCGVKTELLVEAPPLAHENANPALDLARRLAGADTAYRVPFATEAGLFRKAGLASVLCGPGSIDQAHQPDEFITLDQVQAGLDFQRRLVDALS